jgi:ABC-2 type transport system ATP-binding protein
MMHIGGKLKLETIAKSYGKKSVLTNINHEFAPGLTLLVGPSGAGKSTLLRMCATAEKPDTGAIFWDGVSGAAGRNALRAHLGYAPQAVELPEDLTAREFIQHMAALKRLDLNAADKQFASISETIGLHGDIHRRIGAYSGGMRRRLIFAQSLLGTPELIALDEPTAELDSETAGHVISLILAAAQNASVIMTTHLADQLSDKAAAKLEVRDGSLKVLA